MDPPQDPHLENSIKKKKKLFTVESIWEKYPRLKKLFEQFLEDDRPMIYSSEGVSSPYRKMWHTLAEHHNLYSISSGDGRARMVIVSKTPFPKDTCVSTTGMKRFKEDHGLKLNLTDMHDFEYFVELYGKTDELNLMLAAIEELGGEDKFASWLVETKRRIWADMKKTNAWKRLAIDDFQRYKKKANEYLALAPIRKNNCYLRKNNDKMFCSFDLRAANFHAIREYDSDLLQGAETWPEFVEPYIKDVKAGDYLRRSKIFRQKIFWEFPTKHRYIWEAKMASMLPWIEHNRPTTLDEFSKNGIYFMSDEIIFTVNTNDNYLLRLIGDEIRDGLFKPGIKETWYRLFVISNTLNYFVKIVYKDGAGIPTIEFTCIGALHYAIVWKWWHQLPLTEADTKGPWDKETKKYSVIDPATLDLVDRDSIRYM